MSDQNKNLKLTETSLQQDTTASQKEQSKSVQTTGVEVRTIESLLAEESLDKKKKGIKIAAISIAIAVVLSAGLLAGSVFLHQNQLEAEAAASAEQIAKENAKHADGNSDFANDLREMTVDYVLDKEEIPAYTYDQVQAMDMSKPSGVSVADLKLVTRYKLVGTEETLYNLEQNYNLNALFLLGIASHESAYGTSQFHKNNVCGYGYSSYNSIDECLDYVGRALAKYYLDPSGAYYKGPTIDSVNKTYAADSAWDSKVAKKVQYFYQVISENRSKQLEKLK